MKSVKTSQKAHILWSFFLAQFLVLSPIVGNAYQPHLSADQDEIYRKYVLKHDTSDNASESVTIEPEAGVSEVEVLPTQFSLLTSKAQVNPSLQTTSPGKSFFSRIDPKIATDILDVSLGGALGLSLGWRYEVEPTYSGRYHTRIDAWKPSIDVRIGELLSAGPIFFDISAETEFLFVRQFQSKQEAVTDNVIYNIDRDLPINYQKALKMQTGDLVVMPMRKNLVTGIGQGPAGIYQMVSGQFQVQVLRLQDQKVRLRLISGTDFSTGAGLSASVPLEIFELKVADWGLRKVFGRKIVDFSIQTGSGQLFLLDYVLDLSDPDVQKAYNSIVNSPLKLDNWVHDASWNPASFQSQTMVSDLTALDKIMQEDLGLPISQRRIARMFKGQSDYEDQSSTFRLGMRGLYYKEESNRSTQKVVFFDVDNSRQDALVESFKYKNDLNLFWGFWRNQKQFSLSAVAPTDIDGNLTQNPSYIFQQEYKEKTMTAEEINELFNASSIWANNKIRTDLKLNEAPPVQELKNARLFNRIVIDSNLIPRFNNIDLRSLARHYDYFLKKIRLPKQGSFLPEVYSVTGMSYREQREIKKLEELLAKQPKWIQANYRHISKMVEKLVVFFDSKTTEKERMIILADLGSNKAYQQTGIGFLIYLSELSTGPLPDNGYRADFQLSSSNGVNLKTQSGQSDKLDFIEAMEFVQNLIQNGGYDFRIDNFGSESWKQ